MSASKKTPRQAGHRNNVRLLDAIVHQLIEAHQLTSDDVSTEYAESWENEVLMLAYGVVATLPGDKLGRIIDAMPDANLYAQHACTWLGKYESGPYLLRQIAATVVYCRLRHRFGVDRAGQATCEYDDCRNGEGTVMSAEAIAENRRQRAAAS